MRLPSLKLLAVTVLAVGLVGIVTDQVLASTPTVKGKGKVLQVLNFVGNISNFNLDVAIVPENQTMVITDVVVTNESGGGGTFKLICLNDPELGNVDIMNSVFVADDATFAHSFSTGIQCGEFTQVRGTVVAASGANWRVTISGYFRKGDP